MGRENANANTTTTEPTTANPTSNTPTTTSQADLDAACLLDAALATIARAHDRCATDDERKALAARVTAAMRPARTTSHKKGNHATVTVTRNGSIRAIRIETDGQASEPWLAVHIVGLLHDEMPVDQRATSGLTRVLDRLKAAAIAQTQMPGTNGAK